MENEFNIENIQEIVDRYYKQYNLPEMDITDGEWNALLDNLRKCFEKYNNNNDIESAVQIIIRRAINNALFDLCNVINLYYVIKSLDDLKVFQIEEEDIKELRYNIMLDGLKNNTKKDKEITK